MGWLDWKAIFISRDSDSWRVRRRCKDEVEKKHMTVFL